MLLTYTYLPADDNAPSTAVTFTPSETGIGNSGYKLSDTDTATLLSDVTLTAVTYYDTYACRSFAGFSGISASFTGDASLANGLPMATSTGAAVNRYKYSGKEFETRGGLDFYDFDARLQLPTTGLFSRPDPKAIKTPGLNTYLYCAANPIMFIDPTDEQLLLVDSEENIRATMAIYQKAIGNMGTVSWDQSTGLVSIEKNADCTETNAAFDTLCEIVEDSETTTIKVERDTEVLIGDINTGTIDICDIERLGDQGPVTDVGALFHETREQFNLIHLTKEAIRKGVDLTKEDEVNMIKNSAHISAGLREQRIVGYSLDPWRLRSEPLIFNPMSPKGGVMHIIYSKIGSSDPYRHFRCISYDKNMNIIKQ
ncbi:MAG: hypothetical protein K2I64_00775 [Muribaculaceae bacterium]|nr:hypothetical protein [Muribaculaceae bacterium]